MKIRSIAMWAISFPVCVSAANLSGSPLAIYYRFDAPPSAALLTAMQSEVGGILGDAGIGVAWRAAESARNGEDFPGVVFLRFHGVCSWDHDAGANDRAAVLDGESLAETDIADGRVLPFGTVDCDRLRRFLTPAVEAEDPEHRNAALGRAAARVSAHEIYHMLTGSEGHARRGIGRASYTRGELTAQTFRFAAPESDWLRAWAARNSEAPRVNPAGIATSIPAESATAGSGASAGR